MVNIDKFLILIGGLIIVILQSLITGIDFWAIIIYFAFIGLCAIPWLELINKFYVILATFMISTGLALYVFDGNPYEIGFMSVMLNAMIFILNSTFSEK